MKLIRRTGGRRVPNTETSNFVDWFGQSPLRDAWGQPLRLYHGTPWPGFKRFKLMAPKHRTGHETRSLGIWWSTDPEVTQEFTSVEQRAGTLRRGNKHWADGTPMLFPQSRVKHGAVYIGYANLQNPKVYKTDAAEDAFGHLMEDRSRFAEYINCSRFAAEPGFWRRGMIEVQPDIANRLFREHLQAEGYDGIWLRGTLVDAARRKECGEASSFERDMRGVRWRACPHDVVAVFDPAQIRTD